MDYERMYYILVRACSDALDALDRPNGIFSVRYVLQKALLETEDIYITYGEEENDPQ